MTPRIIVLYPPEPRIRRLWSALADAFFAWTVMAGYNSGNEHLSL